MNVRESDLYLYRTHTQALLRRYFRVSLEIGRLPSLLGGQVFRARVTSYRLHTFEDLVVFAHDVERCLMDLDPFHRQVITHVIFEGYNPAEAAVLHDCGSRKVRRALQRGIDELSRRFLLRGILQPFPQTDDVRTPAEPCQEPRLSRMCVTR